MKSDSWNLDVSNTGSRTGSGEARAPRVGGACGVNALRTQHGAGHARSAFRAGFPTARGPAEVPPRASRSDDGDAATGADVRRLMAGTTVMMIDDEPRDMRVLQQHLEAAGYARFVALTDSRQAMNAIREAQPDVLLLDLFMPWISGLELLDEIRRDASLHHVPVIVLSSATDPATRRCALEAGASDVLAKPVDPDELALRLRNTLVARAARTGLHYLDSLTGLPNRLLLIRLLGERLDGGYDAPARAGSAVLILVDIARFTSSDDSPGVDRDDGVLRGVGSRLVAALGARARPTGGQPRESSSLVDRSRACVARLGGNRFAVLLPFDSKVPDREALERHLRRFIRWMEEPFIVNGQASYLQASIGVTTIAPGRGSVESLLDDAETAMHHARHSSASGFAFHSAHMDLRARTRSRLEDGLRDALGRGELGVLYQPRVVVRTGRISGAEALLRWNHPTLGPIAPSHFIPLAEGNGTIIPIGAWVLGEACRQARRWHDLGHADCRIAVNVSVRQLEEPGFVDTVRRALAESDLASSSLILELTESTLMESADSSLVTLRGIKALGVGLAVDDFGTGYSSLACLERFPLDQLKIDRSFIAGIEGSTSPAPIVRAVASLARDLGLSVVAEGVETDDQLARVHDLGCEEYQGYLCSRPLPPATFIERLLQEVVVRR